jgi:helicase
MTHREEFARMPSPFKDIEYEWFLGEVKTAILLMKWINEVSMDEITGLFNVGEGDVHAIADIAQWLMHSTARLAETMGLTGAEKAYELEKRIYYGANAELLELVSIRDVGRVRARRLYNAGLTSVALLKQASVERIAKLIGQKTAEKIVKNIKDQYSTEEVNDSVDINDSVNTAYSSMEKKQRTFYDFDYIN